MTAQQLRDRSKAFAVTIIRFTRTLPRTEEARIIGRQLLRSATGIGANYRAACRRRSDRDFVAKLGVAIEEADETGYWLELLIASGIVTQQTATALLDESDQLTRIFVASRQTARRRMNQQRRVKQHPESPITNR